MLTEGPEDIDEVEQGTPWDNVEGTNIIEVLVPIGDPDVDSELNVEVGEDVIAE